MTFPSEVDGQEVERALASLGIERKGQHVLQVVVEAFHISVTTKALNDQGRAFSTTDGQLATHTHTIQIRRPSDG